MKYVKVIFACCFIVTLLTLSTGSSLSMGLNSNEVHYKQVVKTSDKFNVYLFWEEGDKTSEELISYLSTLDSDLLNEFVLYTFEVKNNIDNRELKNKVIGVLNEESITNPYLIIGNKTFDEYTHSYNDKINDALKAEALNDVHYDVLDYVE